MKTSILKLALAFAIIVCAAQMEAQVTVGSKNAPNKAALLDINELKNDTGGYTATNGAILFPRVELTSKTHLFPFYTPADTLNAVEYAKQKKIHIGLMVYNLAEADDGLCKGLNQWTGNEWNCFQTKMGTAKFKPVKCSSIAVSGIYVKGKEVNTSHYLAITVEVIREGAYSILVRSKRNSPSNIGNGASNGYSYYLTGVALTRDSMTLIVPCQGTPMYPSELASSNPDVFYLDDLVIEGLPLENDAADCQHKVQVMDDVAIYDINCYNITVSGQYRKGLELNNSVTGTTNNKITVHVMVTKAGSYVINTPVTNGISFSAVGVFPAPGTYEIPLIGSGKPTVHSDFMITINTNSPEGNTTCSTKITITLPPMTYGVIGPARGASEETLPGTYGWNGQARQRALSLNSGAFGNTASAIVPVASWTQRFNVATANNAMTALAAYKPDIILFFAYELGGTTSEKRALGQVIAQYVKAGGCVLYGTADATLEPNATTVNELLQGIFGDNPDRANGRWARRQYSNSWSGHGEDQTYKINDDHNDPIINGPFGNTAGKWWGEDNTTEFSVIMYDLPAGSKQICSAWNQFGHTDVPSSYSIVWYDDDMNFVYFGDCVGATAPTYAPSLSRIQYPALYDSNGKPVSKLYGFYPSQADYAQMICNSTLELNAIAYLIRKAAVAGINPHP